MNDHHQPANRTFSSHLHPRDIVILLAQKMMAVAALAWEILYVLDMFRDNPEVFSEHAEINMQELAQYASELAFAAADVIDHRIYKIMCVPMWSTLSWETEIPLPLRDKYIELVGACTEARSAFFAAQQMEIRNTGKIYED